MEKSNELRLEVATKLLAALLIEDRIAWYKDMECLGDTYDGLVANAIYLADKLIDEISEEKESNKN